ncbi:amidohydrolase/deacetylase family metallohydrolase [Paenibacillus glycanilyticus]|uniref:amidohydrolase/deacetylase family metallohydrolase n=1 Tax=Paenibacillus glycanilyticus TaxID=126569 RepID=UPI0020416CD1|nr:amidohydrolase/deacetylase family metallohydrolase [Paenibacillus glycanilyticus]MCM3630799.1 amidohydrolase/deacetylase family metallohydrolase [Paenibacillus glycanilyticus]
MSERIIWRNVRLINSLQTVDIVIGEDGRIAELAAAGTAGGSRIIDCTGLYASSGWIDLHVHAVPGLDPYGDEIDEIGVGHGVTTIVDAGSCGADRIGELAASRQQAKTRVLALLNVSRIGLQRVDELSELHWIDREAVLRAIDRYPDLIVGLKARMSGSVVGRNGLDPLRLARSLSEESGLPLMVHIGSRPPGVEEILPLLRERDVVTHYLNGKPDNRLFDLSGRPLPALLEARASGVRLDVGHGTASFSFEVAEMAKRAGIPFDTISTDIYRGNRLNGPVRSMSDVLTKFLSLGYELNEIIAAVTKRPAEWLGRPELGRVKAGEQANLTLFEVAERPLELIDSEGEKRMAMQTIQARGVYTNGQYLTC